MLRIIINGHQNLRLTQHVPDDILINVLDITNLGGAKHANLNTCKKVADWLYELVQRTKVTIRYNGRVIDKTKVKRYEEN